MFAPTKPIKPKPINTKYKDKPNRLTVPIKLMTLAAAIFCVESRPCPYNTNGVLSIVQAEKK